MNMLSRRIFASDAYKSLKTWEFHQLKIGSRTTLTN
jgi:hypothetical protein